MIHPSMGDQFNDFWKKLTFLEPPVYLKLLEPPVYSLPKERLLRNPNPMSIYSSIPSLIPL